MNPAKDDDPKAGPHPLDVLGLLDLVLPDECVAGVKANMELMHVHARKVEAFDLAKSKCKVIDE